MSAVGPDEELDELAALMAQLEPAHEHADVGDEMLEAGRARVLAAASAAGRFERFVPQVAHLADVSRDRARGWLDRVWGDEPLWEPAAPQALAWWVDGGPRARDALRGFVRVTAGSRFPHHKHLGTELVLLLQGGVVMSDGERLRAGDLSITAAGEEHSFEVVGPGPDLLVFTVVYRGLEMGGQVIGPRPPTVKDGR